MASWKAQYTNVVISQDHLVGERRGRSSREKAEQTSSAAAHNWASLGLKHRNSQAGAWMTFFGPYSCTAFRGDVDCQLSMFGLTHWGTVVNLWLFWNPEFARTDGIRTNNTRKLCFISATYNQPEASTAPTRIVQLNYVMLMHKIFSPGFCTFHSRPKNK